MHPRYQVNLFWSDEGDSWIADLPDLRVCSAFGDTPEEAVREVRVAADARLESAKEHGDPVSEPSYRPAIYSGRHAASAGSAPPGSVLGCET